MAEMGWTGAAIPEEYGGAGLGHLAVCVLAEELGHAVAPVPFSSSVYLATEAIQLFGSDAQKQQLPAEARRRRDRSAPSPWPSGRGRPIRAKLTASCRRRPAERHETRSAGRRHCRPRRGRGARRERAMAASGRPRQVRASRARPVTTIDPTRSHARIVFDERRGGAAARQRRRRIRSAACSTVPR